MADLIWPKFFAPGFHSGWNSSTDWLYHSLLVSFWSVVCSCPLAPVHFDSGLTHILHIFHAWSEGHEVTLLVFAVCLSLANHNTHTFPQQHTKFNNKTQQIVKIACAIVSGLTSIVLIWVIPACLTLPQQNQSLSAELSQRFVLCCCLL